MVLSDGVPVSVAIDKAAFAPVPSTSKLSRPVSVLYRKLALVPIETGVALLTKTPVAEAVVFKSILATNPPPKLEAEILKMSSALKSVIMSLPSVGALQANVL